MLASMGAEPWEQVPKPQLGRTRGGRPALESQDEMKWSDSMRADVEKLWKLGKSTSQIGAALGVTKNAIVGLVSRMRASGDWDVPPRQIGRRPQPQKVEPKAAKSIIYRGEQMDIARAYDLSGSDVPWETAYSRITRLGWTAEQAFETPVGCKPKVKPMPKVAAAKPEKPPVEEPAKLLRSFGVVADAVEALGPKQCKFPIGDPRTDENFEFCQVHRAGAGPYCNFHAGEAYRSIADVRKAAASRKA